MNPYWNLYCRIFKIKICRKCGRPLDKEYKKRRRGKLCIDCYIQDALRAKQLLDIDTL
jgi:NMD protein affecting ribosome stability and mRNA decay